MKINLTALLLAIAYNVINYLFWLHISSLPNATSMIYLFIYPSYWILSLIAVVVLAIKKRRVWFSNHYKISTVIALLFCTPLPFFLIKSFTSPSTYLSSSGFFTEDACTVKYETWNYNSGELNVIKYWKANKPNCNSCDTSYFKRDSTWIYLDKKKDTIQIDIYKDGHLISRKNK